MGNSQVMLELCDVYIGYRENIILSGVNCRLARGTVAGIMGPNGAGKTTLFKGLCGGADLSEGTILLDGEPNRPDAATWRQSVALIPDDNALFSDLTVAEHFELVRLLYEIDRDTSVLRRDRLIDIFGLHEFTDTIAEQLSFGYRKRLAIALAVFRIADVFLFDEPFTGLDASSLGIFGDVIRAIAKSDRIVIIASHVVPLLKNICNDLWILNDGTISPAADTAARDIQTGDGFSLIENQVEMDIPWLNTPDC